MVGLLIVLGGAGCSDKGAGGACQDLVDACDEAGDASCLEDTVQICEYNADGCLVWTDGDICGAGFVCLAGECACDDECTLDDTRCDGDVIQICAVDTYGCLVFGDDTDCAEVNQFCDDTGDAMCVMHDNCGDDQIDGDEVCDGVDLGGATCETEGYHQGQLTCESNCNGLDTSGCSELCGDGVLNGPEACDGAELGNGTCETEGFYSGTLSCAGDCTFDTSGCAEHCGDGILNGPEGCDGTELGGATCASLGFYAGTPSCDATCVVDPSSCSEHCGDGVANGPELCDGGDLGGATCLDLGFATGTLVCNATCGAFDTSGCEICIAGQYHCEGNAVMQCDVGPPSQWSPTGTVCDAGAGYACDASTGACVDLSPIGLTPPNTTGSFYQYAHFDFSTSDFLQGGYDIGSFGDFLYLNRVGASLDIYQVTLYDTDGDGVLEPNQHPDNPYDQGPIEQRMLTHIATYTTATDGVPLGITSRSEIVGAVDRIFMLGPANNGDISEWLFSTHTTSVVADSVTDFPLELLGYGVADGLWYGCNDWGNGNPRRVYTFHQPSGSWVAEFEFPSLGGGHADGLAVVVDPNTGLQYVYVSDMTSDYIGQYRRDPSAPLGWVQQNLFEYSDVTASSVEGMGFGTLNHIWVSAGSYIVELGGGDLQPYLE